MQPSRLLPVVLAVEPVEKIVPIRTLVLVGRIFQPQSCTPGMKRRREHNFSQLGSSARCGDPVCGEVVARSSPWQMCWGSWCLPRGVARGVLSNRIATGVRGTAPQRTLQTHEPGRPTCPTRLRQGVGGRLRQGAGGRRVAICVSQVLTCVTCMVRPDEVAVNPVGIRDCCAAVTVTTSARPLGAILGRADRE